MDPMKLRPKFSIAEHFETVEDPRIERSKAHLLIDILTIATGQCEVLICERKIEKKDISILKK